ncbi:transmembrane protein 235 isoform X6 [Callithrix jacchus]
MRGSPASHPHWHPTPVLEGSFCLFARPAQQRQQVLPVWLLKRREFTERLRDRASQWGRWDWSPGPRFAARLPTSSPFAQGGDRPLQRGQNSYIPSPARAWTPPPQCSTSSRKGEQTLSPAVHPEVFGERVCVSIACVFVSTVKSSANRAGLLLIPRSAQGWGFPWVSVLESGAGFVGMSSQFGRKGVGDSSSPPGSQPLLRRLLLGISWEVRGDSLTSGLSRRWTWALGI